MTPALYRPGRRARIVAAEDPRLVGETVTLIERAPWILGPFVWRTTAPSGWWRRPRTWLRDLFNDHYWSAAHLSPVLGETR
jgi:hypothetical protein